MTMAGWCVPLVFGLMQAKFVVWVAAEKHSGHAPHPSRGPSYFCQSVYFPEESAEVLNDDANKYCFGASKRTLEQILTYGKSVRSARDAPEPLPSPSPLLPPTSPPPPTGPPTLWRQPGPVLVRP